MFSALILAATVAGPQHLPTVVIDAPKAALTLQVARTESQRETGLMYVTKLERHTGMVFVFDNDEPEEFWMKDTLVPLDMVYVAANGVVRDVFEDVPATTADTPDAKIPRRDGRAKYVIELPAFEAAKDGIQIGTVLPRITGLSQTQTPRLDAAFHCAVPPTDSGGDPSFQGVRVPTNAQSDLDIFGAFHTNIGVTADFTLPEAPSNRGLFYSNWIILIPLDGKAFVQLELMRWAKFQYRPEIALSWAGPDGKLAYRDTGMFVSDAPHRLGVAMRGGAIHFTVDGASLCTIDPSPFFTSADRLYFQIGTEVSAPGDHPAGTVSNILLKSDSDATYLPASITCEYRGYGVEWAYDGNGRFHAAGAFDPRKPYLRFTGLDPNERCTY